MGLTCLAIWTDMDGNLQRNNVMIRSLGMLSEMLIVYSDWEGMYMPALGYVYTREHRHIR